MLLLGIAIGIICVIFIEPLIKNLSDLITCLIELGEMKLGEKAAQHEVNIMTIRNRQEEIPETATRAIGFTINPEEEEYDDDDGYST